MCVWQSQAFGGTSKLTGVAGCDAFPNARPARNRHPVKAARASISRRVSKVSSSGFPAYEYIASVKTALCKLHEHRKTTKQRPF
jgi:hypothetical protein